MTPHGRQPPTFSRPKPELDVVRHHSRITEHLRYLGKPQWFTGAGRLKSLDEEGVPIQITERFHRNRDIYSSLVNRLSVAVENGSPQLSDFERGCGAENWATIASLIETCRINAVEPFAYLTATLSSIVNGHKQSRVDDLNALELFGANARLMSTRSGPIALDFKTAQCAWSRCDASSAY
ncbi:transposase domain-containing protein [Rhizobium sp. SU303]|jgi:hypothetical protein|uniref:transposase domain-containing protein n=1 Tax=Rhizobium sp. SU303 TaxID=3138065 RepID=UPI0009B75471|nr:transposase domain-containing protein [Rhizobium leguminosarum]UFW79839.1 transposase domain-containing protein [Rhizobium leguminosarum bv. viciae]